MIRNRLLVHIEYIISFILIPFVVIFRELSRLYDESMILWDLKRQLKAQLERYKKFIQTKKDSNV